MPQRVFSPASLWLHTLFEPGWPALRHHSLLLRGFKDPLKILHGNIKLGGRGKTLEIDESMFGHNRKYNRGAWVFGMVERGSGRALTFRVPDRTRETLVTRLVQEFIQPGTVILSDKFSPYFNLNDIGYTHLMANHSENFVDPYTGAHTNTIEGV